MAASLTRRVRYAVLVGAGCLVGAGLPAEAKEIRPQRVSIESPAQGTIARPGSWVPVKIRLDPAVHASRASLLVGTWQELVSIVDEAPPFDLVLPIDKKWSGPIRVMYSVLSPRNTLVGSGELLINVVPTDLPVSIAVTDPVSMVARSGANPLRGHINVRGTYADGAVRDIGRKELGTSFESSDPSVVVVDSEGFLTARIPGRAIITVKNGELSKSVPIHVRP